MKKAYLLILALYFLPINFSIGQVAINKTSSSSKVALYLEAQKIPTTNYGGFKMPIVTEAQQALIPVSTLDNSDDGLMVFVSDNGIGKHCWDVYDGVDHIWRSINCQNKSCNGAILFSEDFDSYLENTGVTGLSSSNGNYPSGVSKWTLTSFQTFGNTTPALPGTLVDENDYALVKGGELELRDLNGVLRLETESINISGYSNIQISMDIRETGDLEYDPTKHSDDFNCGDTLNDYVDIEYSTDGGNSYTEAPNFSGFGTVNHTIAKEDLVTPISFNVNGVSGTTLILRIRVQNWADDEIFYIDNIVVQCI